MEPPKLVKPETRLFRVAQGQKATPARNQLQAMEFLCRQVAAQRWMSAVLGREVDASLAVACKTGEVLCELMNRLKENSIPARRIKKTPSSIFMEMENVNIFNQAAHAYGVPEYYLPAPSDVAQQKSAVLLVDCIIALADHYKKKGGSLVMLDVQAVRQNPPEFTPAQIREAVSLLEQVEQASSADWELLSSEDCPPTQPSTTERLPDPPRLPSAPTHVHSTGLHDPCVVAIGGGTEPVDILSTIAIFDRAQNQWSNDAAPMRVKRTFHAAASLGEAIYVMGGARDNAKKTAERYDVDANRWTDIAPMKCNHSEPAAASLGGRVYVMGGRETTAVEHYDPSTNRWVRGPALPVKKGKECFGPAAVSIGNALYVMGGCNKDCEYLDSVYRLDPRGRKWLPLAPMLTPRYSHAVTSIDENTLYVIGGDHYLHETVERFDVRAGRWAEAQPMRVHRQGLAAVAMEGNQIMALGGFGAGCHNLSTVQLYDTHTDTWRDGPPLPQARGFFAAVGL